MADTETWAQTLNKAKRHRKSIFIAAISALVLLYFGHTSVSTSVKMTEATRDGNEFIKLCAQSGPEIISQALNLGADPNAVWEIRDNILVKYYRRGDTPLLSAIRFNNNIESVRLIIAGGAEINAASGQALVEAVNRNRADYVALLLEKGAQVNAANTGSWNIMFLAASKNPKIVSLLLDAGVDLKASDTGRTALHSAAIQGSPEVIDLLVAAGLDPNAADKEGDTPLHVHLGSTAAIKSLVRAGADVNLENNKGLAPFEVNDRPDLIEAFMVAGAQPVVRGAEGRLKVRGFAKNFSGQSLTRFFEADDQIALSNAKTIEVSALQAKALAVTPLEPSAKVDFNRSRPGLSKKIVWIDDINEQPVEDLIYYMESQRAAVVYGRSETDGSTARFYIPGRETVTWEGGYPAERAAAGIPSSGLVRFIHDQAGPAAEGKNANDQKEPRPSRHGERVCFVDPEKRLPVQGYPYFMASDDGYAISGKTGRGGCSAELFTPASGLFTVYGGRRAQQMSTDEFDD